MTPPTVVRSSVYPVAGHDSMELNLSGAHAPYFSRNVLILEDCQRRPKIEQVATGEN